MSKGFVTYLSWVGFMAQLLLSASVSVPTSFTLLPAAARTLTWSASLPTHCRCQQRGDYEAGIVTALTLFPPSLAHKVVLTNYILTEDLGSLLTNDATYNRVLNVLSLKCLLATPSLGIFFLLLSYCQISLLSESSILLDSPQYKKKKSVFILMQTNLSIFFVLPFFSKYLPSGSLFLPRHSSSRHFPKQRH